MFAKTKPLKNSEIVIGLAKKNPLKPAVKYKMTPAFSKAFRNYKGTNE